MVERLKPVGLANADPGPVYRALRWLEEAKLVRSRWHNPEAGPARRVYRITAVGRRTLSACATQLGGTRQMLDHYVARHDLLASGP